MSNGKKPDYQKKDQQKNPVIERIQQVKSFSEIKVEEYALPGGFAEEIARREKDMKTAQLRKFFTKIKNLEKKLQGKNETLSNDFKNEVYLIIPELAYSKGRGLIKQEFFEIITTAIKDKLKTVDDFRNFSRFMTAIVAYKKAQGG
jgi:CRISPR-associated protein Csm2